MSNYSTYLSEVPTYTKKSDDVALGQAQRASRLAYATQLAAAKKNQRLAGAQHVNNLQDIKNSTAGVEEANAYNQSLAKKSNALRSISMGGSGSNGLSSYLNQQTDQGLAAQNLAAAVNLAGMRNKENTNYDTTTQNYLTGLEGLAANRDQSAYNTYSDLVSAEDTRAANSQESAKNIANAIWSNVNTENEMADRKEIEANRIAEQIREANLPYNNMTQKEKAEESRLTVAQQGGTPANPNSATGLRQYIESNNGQIAYDANSGNLNINGTIYNPNGDKRFKLVNGTYLVPQSFAQELSLIKS